MIRRAVPIRYDRIATSGRTKPLRIVVETSDGQEHEAFLKMSGRPELGIEGLANEALAACLAGDLGLPICEPFLVELDPDWIDSIPDPPTRDVLHQSALVAFASKAAGPQWKAWSAGDRVTLEREATALGIMAFDAYIENDDRKLAKPNCLVRGSALRIIDHELAFRLRQKLFPPPEPWKLGNLQRFAGSNGHLFASGLEHRQLDFERVRDAWRAIDDDRLMGYLAAQPREWSEGRVAMEEALTHLRKVRDRIDDCMAELERILR